MQITPASPDNEAIRELRDSSKRLENLTEKLSKSSEGLEHFTKILISLTMLLVVLTLATLIIPPDTPSSVRYLGVLIIFGLVIYLLSPKKIH